MPSPYPVLGTNDSESFYTIFKFVNTSGTNGLFMPVMLAVIWLVAFIGAISEGRQGARSFIFASFLCSVLAIVLSLMGFLAPQYMYFLFLMLASGLVWYSLSNAPGL